MAGDITLAKKFGKVNGPCFPLQTQYPNWNRRYPMSVRFVSEKDQRNKTFTNEEELRLIKGPNDESEPKLVHYRATATRGLIMSGDIRVRVEQRPLRKM